VPAPSDYEQRFRRAGLPSFIAERTARQDVWTRALPLLGLVAGAEVLGAVDLKLSLLTNVLLVVAAVALLSGGLALTNALRRRPLLSGPAEVGTPELVAFVVLPATLPLLLNEQPVSALVTAAANLALLAFLYAVIAYGLVSIVRWAGRRLLGQLVTAGQLVARAIPLLLLFSVVLFINTEMWQVFAGLANARIAVLVGLLGLLATGFLVVRLPREVGALQADIGEDSLPLDRRERVNVGLVLLVSQGLQVLVVAVGVGVFFVALGLLTVSTGLVETWTGSAPTPVLGSGSFVVSAELLRVATAIASFSGFYYAIAVLTDATYREEFASEITQEMRQSFIDRGQYLRSRAGSPPP
jgi:hypothetical protein